MKPFLFHIIVGRNSEHFAFKLPYRLLRKLAQEAEERNITIAELIRGHLYEKYLGDLIDEARADWKALKREWKKKKQD